MEKIKRNLRNKNGEFCNVQQWFEEFAGTYRVIESRNSFSDCRERLTEMKESFTKMQNVLEIALNCSLSVESYTRYNKKFEILKDGHIRIDLNGIDFDTDEKKEIISAFCAEMKKEIEEQEKICYLAEKTEIEVEA
jgi:hypothetical protein